MPANATSTFCMGEPAYQAWTQSMAADGVQEKSTDAALVLQLQAGARCVSGQVQVNVNVGAAPATLVALPMGMPSSADMISAFAIGFGVLFVNRPISMCVYILRSLSRRVLP